MEVIFHGHSFVEIEDNGNSIFIDPFIQGNSMIDNNLNFFKTKNIQAVIITHPHHDHIGDTVELAKHSNCLVITTFEVANYLNQDINVNNIYSMHIGGDQEFDGFNVKFVNAVHGPGAAGVVIRKNNHNIYHAGDTGLTYDMKLLSEFDHINLAFIPIGGNYTMGVEDAIIATKFVNPDTVVPIHYNEDNIKNNDLNNFAKQVLLNNYSQPKILNSGQFIVY